MVSKSAIVSTLPVPIYLRAKWLDSRLRDPGGHSRRQRMRRIETPDGYSYEPFDRTRSIFVHVPKCAGVSVCRALYGNLGPGHTPFSEYPWIFDPNSFQSYFKFTFVRNPWDRLVSAYHFLKRGGMNDADLEFAKVELKPYNSFDAFVRGWLNEDNIWKRHHFRPQFFYLEDLHRRVHLDFIGRFENLRNDFLYVADKLKISADLPRSNMSTHLEFRSLYSDETRAIVSRVYAQDIKQLQYTF